MIKDRVPGLDETGVARLGTLDASDPWLCAAQHKAQVLLASSTDTDWRAGGTWFAGVDQLPNDLQGALGGVPMPRELAAAFGPVAWHPGQVSAVRPGYPRPDPGESAASARFRANRNAAHVDGLLPIGPTRRRMLREPHGFILGVALTDVTEATSPLVIYAGSHRIIGAALAEVLRAHSVSDWPEVDLTETYHAARRSAFEQCARILITGPAGLAFVVHRHALHGIAPWSGHNVAAPARQIVYFRPQLGFADWLPD